MALSLVKQINQKSPAYVVKRDGSSAPFDRERIFEAVAKAGTATQEFDEDEARLLTSLVTKVVDVRFEKKYPSIEDIQDIVEQTLISSNHFKTARAYIIYREQHKKLRQDKKAMVDAIASVNEYVDRLDWRVQANANQGYSLGGLILNVSGKIIANYWLNQVYPEEIGAAHRDGSFHIHDLDMLSGYCAGWSLRGLLNEGFNGVPGKAEAKPPKHFSAAIGQMVNFLGTLQNEWAGAQAFSSFDTYLAPFVHIDNLNYEQVLQGVQELVYNLNVPSRWGTQTPFTNLTFDLVCPDDLKDQAPLVGGHEVSFKYGELQSEMDMLNKAYIETMIAGDAKGRIFTFPLPTYNITKDFPWDSKNADLLFEMTAKYGSPYFQNFLNSDLKPSMVRSMCCRLQLDVRELLKRGNGLFGSAEQTGSVGIVTINCARLGYLYKGDEAAMFSRLSELMELAKASLEIKRKVIQRYMDAGLFPFTKRYLGTLKNHFSTIGVNGVNEMLRNFTGDKENISTKEGSAFAHKILDFARAKLVEFQTETGTMYNLEASPAEGATYRFAKEDKKRFVDIIQAGKGFGEPYYTNSSQLPVDATNDIFEALDNQSDLQRKYTGGSVFHAYMKERISSSAACKELVKRILTNYKLPYITITPTFSICPKHGYIQGECKFCPMCDEEILFDRLNKKPI
jgi:ribonucleoside-triphosphate reductase